jgi:predicted RNA-binding Zn ribbon-like protein
MQLTNDPSLSIASQRIAEDFEAFIARGGQVEEIPRGAMAEMGWTAKQRANRPVSTKASIQAECAEREARKLAKASIPAPRGSERPPVKPKRQPRAPRPAKTPVMDAALEALRDGDTAPVLAERIGKNPMAARMLLDRLRTAGKVFSKGVSGRHATWHRVDPKA